LKYYEDLFGTPYPFGKYDQVFVPEHIYGAMENVGCVTFNERCIVTLLSKTSVALSLKTANTFLHELSHMWFGNLVTMKWWDDLWLNEAFATYLSYRIMTEEEEMKKEFPTTWVSFQQYKFWGINTDQLSSTHPICAPINSTIEAESLFDGISYGKGSAFIQQVFYVLGRDVVKAGLYKYFETFKWKNTSLNDFVECL
jgi:aminopeptidase N